MASLLSENRAVVLAGLTVSRLESSDVKVFGKLSVAEKKAAAHVVGRAVLSGDQAFKLTGCTPKSPANAILGSCNGKGKFVATGEVSFSGRKPLVLVGDEATCKGTCQVPVGSGTKPEQVKCILKIKDHGQPAPKAVVAKKTKSKSVKEHPAVAVCYLTATNELLLLDQTGYDQMLRDAAPLLNAIIQLNDAKGRGDDDAARAAQTKAEELLPPIKGLHLSGEHVAEVLDFRGKKMTYVRSDKIANHIRRYPIDVDIRDQSLLRDKNGKFDSHKIKKAFSQLKVKLPVGPYSSEPWDHTLCGFAEALNEGLRFESTGNPRFDTSAEARLFRLYGQWFKTEATAKSLKEWKFTVSTEATFSVLEAAARFVWWPTTDQGKHFDFSVPGYNHPLDFGWFRPMVTGTVRGFAGVSLTGSIGVEVTKKKGFAGLTASAEAFAGVRAEFQISASLSWKPPDGSGQWLELGKVGYGAGLALGLGAGGNFTWGLDRNKGKIFLRVRGQLVFAAGAKGDIEFEVEGANLLAVARCILHTLRAADFQPMDAIEDGVSEMLGDLLSWAAAAGQKLEEAYRMLEQLRDWWRMPWTWLTVEGLTERLSANEYLISLTPPEGRGKLLRLLCDPMVQSRTGTANAVRQVASRILESARTTREEEKILAYTSPGDKPWTPDIGRNYLLASGLMPQRTGAAIVATNRP